MNDRDCEYCKNFTRNDPYESEGYCQTKRSWVDPQEGEDCKMHEFTLLSAIKYKDGTPIMSEPEKVYCDTDSAPIHGESNQLDSKPNQFGINFCEQHLEHIMDMDAVLATHAGKINSHTDMLEEYLNRICELEHLYEKVIDYVCELREKVDKNFGLLNKHKGSNFCGNCTHVKSKDGIYTCGLLGGNVNPDDSSCSVFEPPF